MLTQFASKQVEMRAVGYIKWLIDNAIEKRRDRLFIATIGGQMLVQRRPGHVAEAGIVEFGACRADDPEALGKQSFIMQRIEGR